MRHRGGSRRSTARQTSSHSAKRCARRLQSSQASGCSTSGRARASSWPRWPQAPRRTAWSLAPTSARACWRSPQLALARQRMSSCASNTPMRVHSRMRTQASTPSYPPRSTSTWETSRWRSQSWPACCVPGVARLCSTPTGTRSCGTPEIPCACSACWTPGRSILSIRTCRAG